MSTDQTIDTTVWRMVADPLRWRTWDDETVIFHGGSGDTLLLNPLATEVLHVLRQGDASETALVRAVGAAFADEPDEALPRAVRDCLQRLARAQLIEPLA